MADFMMEAVADVMVTTIVKKRAIFHSRPAPVNQSPQAIKYVSFSS
jgi:hypothetical protein